MNDSFFFCKGTETILRSASAKFRFSTDKLAFIFLLRIIGFAKFKEKYRKEMKTKAKYHSDLETQPTAFELI